MSIEAMKQALEALEKLNGALEQADCSTGYCCCGSSVDGHTFGDGHSPVDEGAYFQSNALEYARKTITSLRQAIEQAEKQEPFAWCIESEDSADWCFAKTEEGVKSNSVLMDEDCIKTKPFPLYTTPPAAQRQPLTDDEIDEIWNRYCDEMGEASINDAYDIARAIEAAHGIKEKNT